MPHPLLPLGLDSLLPRFLSLPPTPMSRAGRILQLITMHSQLRVLSSPQLPAPDFISVLVHSPQDPTSFFQHVPHSCCCHSLPSSWASQGRFYLHLNSFNQRSILAGCWLTVLPMFSKPVALGTNEDKDPNWCSFSKPRPSLGFWTFQAWIDFCHFTGSRNISFCHMFSHSSGVCHQYCPLLFPCPF